MVKYLIGGDAEDKDRLACCANIIRKQEEMAVVAGRSARADH